MEVKENNKKHKTKFIKCDKCKERLELDENEIVKMAGIKYIECPYCGQQIILK